MFKVTTVEATQVRTRRPLSGSFSGLFVVSGDDLTLVAYGSAGKRCSRPLWFACNEDIPVSALLKVGCTLRAYLDAMGIDRMFALVRTGTPWATLWFLEDKLERAPLGFGWLLRRLVPHHRVS